MTETGCGSGSVSIDAVSTGVTTGSSLTISHTTSGTNRLMLVGVSIAKQTGGAPSVSSITYNGVGLSLVGAQANSDNKGRMEIWRLVAPATGANNVVVTLSAAPDAATAGVMTFADVNQSTPLGTFTSATGDSASASVTVASAANELVFDTMVLESSANDDLVPGAGQTERWDLYLAPALQTLDRLVAHGQGGSYDFAFIDADKENYWGYYERSLALLRAGGLIAIDNTLWSGRPADLKVNDADTASIRAFNQRLSKDSRVRISLVPIGDGMTLALKLRA